MTDVSFGIGADNSELKRVVAESNASMKEFFASVTDSAGGLGSILEDMQGKFAAAFQVTGIAVAYEAINKVGEMIESLGARALQMKTVADVLGVTTDQFQAMQVAAEEAGVGSEVLTHAGEHLVSILNEARNGTGSAIDKLMMLGVTAAQIADPTFTLNDLLQVLHDRLTNTATAQSTMNELIQVLGARAALAAEALKLYDGSAESVAAVMAKMNGLSSEQIDKASELKVKWGEFTTQMTNASEKTLLFVASMGQWIQAHVAIANAAGNMVGASATQGAAPQAATDPVTLEQQKDQQILALVQGLANERRDLDREMALEEMQNVKAGIDAYKQGSAERLAAVTEYARLAQQYYGSSDVDVVVKANQAKIAETRAYNETQKTELQKLVDFAEQLDTRAITEHARTLGQLNSLDIKQASDREKQLQELADFAEQLDLRVTNEHAKVLAQMTALNTKQAQDFLNKWKTVSSAVESGFTSAISGMIQGTETFSQAVKGIFTSIIDGLVSMFVRMGVEWAETQIANALITKTTAQAGIQSSAAQAGAAGIASFAGAPWPVDLGAPAFGAAMALEAASFAAASAAGGYDIPSGVNPVVQTHAREMILPATLADTVRNMATGGGKGKSGTLNYQPVGGGHGLVTHSELAETLRQLGLQFKLQRF